MDEIRLSQIIAPAFYPVYHAAKSGDYGEIWLKGGRGSCKSSFVSVMIVMELLRDPKASAIIYRKVADTLRESVYAQIVWAIQTLGVGRYFDFGKSPLEIKRRSTGQRILFRGADKPEKSKGVKLPRGYFKCLWFEELTEFASMDDVRTIKASVLRGSDQKTLTFYSYNPPMSAQNWVNEQAIQPVAGRYVHQSDYRSVPPQWLGADFLAEAEALKETNERAYRHMYLGEVTGTGGQVFDNLSLRAITDAEIAGFDRFYNGVDFGFAGDPDALTRCCYAKSRRALYIVGERYGTGNAINALAGQCKALFGGEVATCDCEDPRLIAELRNRGVQAVAARKGPGSVEHGVRWLQSLGEIVIDPARCPNAAREFELYEYRRDKQGNVLSELCGHDDHTIDSVRYGVERLSTLRTAKTFDRGKLGI